MFEKPMQAIGIAALILTAGPGLALAGQNDGSYQVAYGGCPYYVILGCFGSQWDANNHSNSIGGRVVNTSHVSGFNPGYWCVVDGPHNQKSYANSLRASWRSTVHDAYVKQGCE